MVQWIRILYDNKALIKYKNLKMRFIIPLFLLIVLFVSIPNFIGLYTSKAKDVLSNYNEFSSDFITLIKTVDCTITDKLTSVGYEGNGNNAIILSKYKVWINPNERIIDKNTISLYKDYVMIVGDDKNYILGDYALLGGYNFTLIRQQLNNGNIKAADVASTFVKSVYLSQFNTNIILIYMGLLFNLGIYTAVIPFLFRYVSTKIPRPLNFKRSLAVIVQSMFMPAMLSAIFGFIIPNQAFLIFLMLIVFRIVWLYQGIIHKKIHLDDE
ncbi:MAG: hypothetical protein WCI62_00200 [Erysipelotrichaceae bacterium]